MVPAGRVESEMDEIEAGFSLLIKRVKDMDEMTGQLATDIIRQDGALLGRMAALSIPVVQKIGLALLRQGKQDTKGELYDASFYDQKMIVLGKTDPVPHRPDNPGKAVTDQFCVLSEKGMFYELMYSSDGFIVDSYLNEISPEEAIGLYTHEVVLMLYRALHDYLSEQEDLLAALEKTLAFIQEKIPVSGNSGSL